MRVLWLILVLALMISFISAEQQFVQDDDDDFLDFDQVDDTQGATPKGGNFYELKFFLVHVFQIQICLCPDLDLISDLRV